MRSYPKPSQRYAEYVRPILACGHWRPTWAVRSDAAEIVNVQSGRTLWYQLHDGGNALNSARNFAADAQRECGCQFVQARGRKRSRKAVRASGYSPEVARRESGWFWDKRGEDVASLVERRDECIAAIQKKAHVGGLRGLVGAAALLRRISDIEDVLIERFHQPVERFDFSEWARTNLPTQERTA